MNGVRLTATLAFVVAGLLVGCGGGGSSGGEASDDISDLVLIDVNVGGTDGVPLNQIVSFEFSEQVVGSTVTPETMRIRLSPANAKQVPGDYNISGNIIEFFPRLPVAPDLSDAGLLPGSTYEIKLPGGHKTNTLENADGDPLARTYKVSFATAVASSPDVFTDYNPDAPPQVVSVNPKHEAVDVPQSVVPELTFSEPLHPSTVTTGNITLTMTHRPPGTELDPKRPIQGHLIFAQNRHSVTVQFVSDFPLADDATYALSVDRRVSDLAGNDLEAFESSFTIRDEPPVPGVFSLDFGPGTQVWEDPDVTIASWNGDIPGTLCAIFTAGAGDGSDGDFDPSFNTMLSSDTRTTWNFRSFKVPSGVTVTLTGEKPITLLSLARMEIAGTLLASGKAGGKGETNSRSTAVPANPGGKGGPGGGDGGDASTKASAGTAGEDGYGTTGTGAGAAGFPSSGTYLINTTGGSGGGHRTAGKKGSQSQYTYYPRGSVGAAGGTGGNQYLDPLTGGGGGGPGQNVRQQYSNNIMGAGSGGGGGGGIELRSANNIEITGGKILADGGNGGANGSTYITGAPGGGGAGGAILIRSLKNLVATNATLSVKGGKGVTSGMYTYYTGKSADGGDGWVRLDDSDASPSLTQTAVDPSTRTSGTFTAVGAGAPSVGQTLWMNMGVFDPTFLSSELTQVIAKTGQMIKVEIQGAPEDIFDFGMPDEDLASSWTEISDLTTLNGYGHSFIRLRVTFTLADDQTLEDPMPYVDLIRILYQY